MRVDIVVATNIRPGYCEPPLVYNSVNYMVGPGLRLCIQDGHGCSDCISGGLFEDHVWASLPAFWFKQPPIRLNYKGHRARTAKYQS